MYKIEVQSIVTGNWHESGNVDVNSFPDEDGALLAIAMFGSKPLNYRVVREFDDKPFFGHPNLAPEVNNAIANSELMGGAYIDKLAVGRTLRVQTVNTTYLIKRVAEGKEGLTIQGHPRYCPEPTPAHILGSNFGGSMLKVGFVGRGMYMEFCRIMPEEDRKRGSVDGHGLIVTSQIQEVEEIA
jgi:hypothetical protein